MAGDDTIMTMMMMTTMMTMAVMMAMLERERERERERKREGRLNNTTEKKEKEVMPAPLVGLCQVIM